MWKLNRNKTEIVGHVSKKFVFNESDGEEEIL